VIDTRSLSLIELHAVPKPQGQEDSYGRYFIILASDERTSRLFAVESTYAGELFVDLYGTVWGIMYSFIGVAQFNTTNLAVIAPGIAEALVVVYNQFNRVLACIKGAAGNLSTCIGLLVSRDLDRNNSGR
jgi:biopolymer transport protein ExbB